MNILISKSFPVQFNANLNQNINIDIYEEYNKLYLVIDYGIGTIRREIIKDLVKIDWINMDSFIIHSDIMKASDDLALKLKNLSLFI